MATKKDSIEVAIANLEKQFNKTSEPIIRKGVRSEPIDPKNLLSFGIQEVDDASHCGGIPLGKMIEIFGPESGGKSFLSLKLIASAQKKGLTCCLIDAEQSFDPAWAEMHGINTEDLYIIDASIAAETIMDYVNGLLQTGHFGLIVVDSTAALIPKAELEADIEKNDIAQLARVMSKACKKIIQNCASNKATCVFINQIREKPGLMFGNPETTPGGRALKFYSHMRVKVAPGAYIKIKQGGEEVIIGKKAYITFVKNKVAAPYGKAEPEIIFEKEALNLLVKLCSFAKDHRLFSVYQGEFKLKKDIVGAKKNVSTGTRTFIDLSNYVYDNNLVTPLLDELISMSKEDPNLKVPDDLLELSEDMEALENLEVIPKSPEYLEYLSKEGSLEEDSDDFEVE